MSLDHDYRTRALNYVRHVMSETGLSVGGLARKAGLAASTLTRPINNPSNQTTLSLAVIGKIATATGIDPAPYLACSSIVSNTGDAFAALSGPEISRIRMEKGLGQAQVAAAVGCHWVTISKLETGAMKMTLDWLNRLAPVLGLGEVGFLSATATSDQSALTDLLGFLHFLRAERSVVVPERHFETLRALQAGKACT